MKKLLLISVPILLITVALFFYWQNTRREIVGTLNMYAGTEAALLRNNIGLTGVTGTEIEEEDSITLHPDTRASIVLKAGGLVRLEAGSKVRVGKIEYKDGKLADTVFKLEAGRMWSHIRAEELEGSYAIETPTAVATVRGTAFNIDYLQEASVIFVREGLVSVNLIPPQPTPVLVSEGEFLILRNSVPSDFDVGPQKATPEFFDEWIQFNLQEDIREGLSVGEKISETKPTDKPPAGTIESQTSNPKPPETPGSIRTLTSLTIYGYRSVLVTGQETKLKVLARYSNGSSEDLAFDKITWIKSDNVGVVSSPGYFSSGRAGTVKIKVQVDNIVSNEITITVSEPAEQETETVNPNNETTYPYPNPQ